MVCVQHCILELLPALHLFYRYVILISTLLDRDLTGYKKWRKEVFRFYITDEQICNDEIFIEGGDVNHIRNVLRLEKGDWVVACNGEGKDYVSRIASIEKEQVVLQVEKVQETGTELPTKITLFQGLPKGDKMETVIQKMVELGVYGIVPVSTKRSIVKLDAKKAANKVKRWNAISESAAKQSKRGIIPRVNDVCTFKQAIDMAKELDMIIMPYEEADDMEKTRNIIRGLKKDTSVGIFIGPEGGFAKEEVNAVMEENGTPITLGKRILRTETAGMAIMSVIMFMMEE